MEQRFQIEARPEDQAADAPWPAKLVRSKAEAGHPEPVKVDWESPNCLGGVGVQQALGSPLGQQPPKAGHVLDGTGLAADQRSSQQERRRRLAAGLWVEPQPVGHRSLIELARCRQWEAVHFGLVLGGCCCQSKAFMVSRAGG